MLFPTATFAIFFMLVLPLSWLVQPRPERWKPFIIAASFVFYAAWDWRFCFLLAFSIVWNQVLAVAIHRRSDPRTRKWLLAAALVALLVVGWATAGGGAAKIGRLFDRVIDSVIDRV